MTFSFTERANDILTEDFLFQITKSSQAEDELKNGIQVFNLPGKEEKVLLTQLDKNLYRLPIIYLDSFIRCLFKYLPATFVEGNNKTDYYPSCVNEKVERHKS